MGSGCQNSPLLLVASQSSDYLEAKKKKKNINFPGGSSKFFVVRDSSSRHSFTRVVRETGCGRKEKTRNNTKTWLLGKSLSVRRDPGTMI